MCEDVKKKTRVFKKQKCSRREKKKKARAHLGFSPLKPITSYHTNRNHNSPNTGTSISSGGQICCLPLLCWLMQAASCLSLYCGSGSPALPGYAAFQHIFQSAWTDKILPDFCQGALTFSERIRLNDGALGKGNGFLKKNQKNEGGELVYVLSCWKQRCQSRIHRWMHPDMQTHHTHIMNTWHDGRRFTDD